VIRNTAKAVMAGVRCAGSCATAACTVSIYGKMHNALSISATAKQVSAVLRPDSQKLSFSILVCNKIRISFFMLFCLSHDCEME
jgi:hypothetical protein